jgi:hypothetical protein
MENENEFMLPMYTVYVDYENGRAKQHSPRCLFKADTYSVYRDTRNIQMLVEISVAKQLIRREKNGRITLR